MKDNDRIEDPYYHRPTSKYDWHRKRNPAGFDDVYVERTDENGICDTCGRACRLYIRWNRGYLREDDAPQLVCKACSKE